MRPRIKTYEERIYKAVSTKTGRPRKHSLEQIAEMYTTGTSTTEIGRLLGIHHSNVLYALRQLGIERRPRGRRSGSTVRRSAIANRDARIRELYVDWGWSSPEIAEEVGLVESSVLAALARTGTPRRKPGTRYPTRRTGIRAVAVDPMPSSDGFVDYSAYRKQYRETLRIERMLESMSTRKVWAA